MAAKSNSEIRQVGRFGLVGVLNTIIDFAAFNLLAIALSATWAGILSGTIAMISSYIFNQRFTFRSKHVAKQQIVAFFALTAFGIYVIRPIIIHVFTKSWLWPASTAHTILHTLGLPFTVKFVTNNVALVAAIFVVLFL